VRAGRWWGTAYLKLLLLEFLDFVDEVLLFEAPAAGGPALVDDGLELLHLKEGRKEGRV
jgi:hypothetical protein